MQKTMHKTAGLFSRNRGRAFTESYAEIILCKLLIAGGKIAHPANSKTAARQSMQVTGKIHVKPVQS